MRRHESCTFPMGSSGVAGWLSMLCVTRDNQNVLLYLRKQTALEVKYSYLANCFITWHVVSQVLLQQSLL